MTLGGVPPEAALAKTSSISPGGPQYAGYPLGAVATASFIFDLLFWSLGFLRMATTSIVSHYHGSGDRRSCTETLYRALLLALLLAGLIVLARDLVAGVGFELAGGSSDVREWGQRYFGIRVLRVPLVLCTVVMNGFFLGLGCRLGERSCSAVRHFVSRGWISLLPHAAGAGRYRGDSWLRTFIPEKVPPA